MKEANNKLIAEFLEWKVFEGYSYITPFFQNYMSVGNGMEQTPVWRMSDLKFHKSWDWIMLVVVQISFELDKPLDETFAYLTDLHEDNIWTILDLYQAVLKFIEKMTDTEAKETGKRLCAILSITPKNGVISTSYGNKTFTGLGHMINELINKTSK